MIYLTSDLHKGHANLIFKFHDRQFGSVKEMDEHLIRCWNEVVGPNDEVINLGDIFLGTSRQEAIKFLKQLNGKHCLIIGNHDERHINAPEFRECFEWIKDKHEIEYNGYKFILQHKLHFHCPTLDKTIYCHGHTHQKHPLQYSGQINVGVDAWNYHPISLDQVIQAYELGKSGKNVSIETLWAKPKPKLSYYFWRTIICIKDLFRGIG